MTCGSLGQCRRSLPGWSATLKVDNICHTEGLYAVLPTLGVTRVKTTHLCRFALVALGGRRLAAVQEGRRAQLRRHVGLRAVHQSPPLAVLDVRLCVLRGAVKRRADVPPVTDPVAI